jgi:hypothetical protein
MPHRTPLRTGDPRRVGRYSLTGRLAGIPTEDPIFIGVGPDGAEVAISMLPGDWAQDAAARDRFAAEAAVAKRVPPFCAARVLDAGLEGADAYLVSEYVPGQSLLELVAADGVRRAPDLDAIAIGMATGLAAVHQAGLVHGNFGPQYVIMGNEGPPRVVEFGITPPYGSATPSADMLAWAQTVVFAAAGRPPASLEDLDVLPDHIREPVERCLDPDPSERPAARAVVLSLLGDAELSAGVLAEGSRRAARPAARPTAHDQFQPGPRHSGAGQPSSRLAAAGQVHSGRQRRSPQDKDPAGSRHSRGGAAPPRRPAQPEPAGNRRTGWVVGAALVVAVLIGAALVHVVQDSGSQASSGKLSANTGQDGKLPSASPSPTASVSSVSPVTPTAFAGSWSGQVKQPPTDTYNVSVELAAGATSGTISYSATGFSCSGALNLTAESSQKLTMSQGILQGGCENGQVTMTLTSSSTLWFSFSSNGPSANGTLTRS